MPEIVETKARVKGWDKYTGNYRLIFIPGGYIDLPGHGGRTTQQAAKRALAVLAAGGTNLAAQDAAYSR